MHIHCHHLHPLNLIILEFFFFLLVIVLRVSTLQEFTIMTSLILYYNKRLFHLILYIQANLFNFLFLLLFWDIQAFPTMILLFFYWSSISIRLMPFQLTKTVFHQQMLRSLALIITYLLNSYYILNEKIDFFFKFGKDFNLIKVFIFYKVKSLFVLFLSFTLFLSFFISLTLFFAHSFIWNNNVF